MNPDLQTPLQRWLDDPLTGKLLWALGGIALVLLIAAVLRRVISSSIRDSNLRYQARKLVTLVGYLAAGLFVALIFADQLAGLPVALGLAGAGVAVALREVIASLAGWFAIAFGGIYRVGDRVQVAGIRGDVIDISMQRTTIMEIGQWVEGDLYNGRLVRVANAAILKEPVFNYSGEFPFVWDEITLPIAYKSDWRLARQILERVAKEVVGAYADSAEAAWGPITRRYVIENATVQPMISMTADENWITLTLRYVVDYRFRRTTKSQLFERILDELEQKKDDITIAGATLALESLHPLEVHLEQVQHAHSPDPPPE